MPPDDTDGLVRRELRRRAELEPSSGRQAQAKATALRALLRLEGRGGRELTEAEERLWDPDRREDEPVDEDDWHPSRDTGFFELDLCHGRSTAALVARAGRRQPSPHCVVHGDGKGPV